MTLCTIIIEYDVYILFSLFKYFALDMYFGFVLGRPILTWIKESQPWLVMDILLNSRYLHATFMCPRVCLDRGFWSRRILFSKRKIAPPYIAFQILPSKHSLRLLTKQTVAIEFIYSNLFFWLKKTVTSKN